MVAQALCLTIFKFNTSPTQNTCLLPMISKLACVCARSTGAVRGPHRASESTSESAAGEFLVHFLYGV